MKKYTTEDYIAALRSLNISPHHLKMLQVHYSAPERTLTALHMAKATGYHNHHAANLHYGKLGRLVGDALGWNPSRQGADAVYILAEFRKPGRNWLWIMRPELSMAIENLGWDNKQEAILPEEITDTIKHYEGALRSINVNAYERSAAARSKCLLYYGCQCAACGINLSDVYGEIAQGYIHVHHLRQLSEINAEFQVDPIQDLRPLCPNCHAIIHLRNPPLTIEELKILINDKRNANK